ncbi:MAG: hypothetical protein J1E85_08000 [Ruminococcus sp.]|nr:hypothetical protein [Ruminococcus sp.]
MSRSRNSSKIKKIVCVILSFILSLFLFVLSIGVVLEATIFNSDFILENMNSSNYFVDKKDEITRKLNDLGYASGLDDEFFENLLDEIMLTEDNQEYLNDYYDGKSALIDTTRFKQTFNDALDKYIEEHNIKNVDSASRDYLVNKASSIYRLSLEIPLFYRIAGYFKALKNIFPFILAGVAVIIFIIILIFVFSNKWKHRAFRYVSHASLGACLSLAVIPAYVLLTGQLQRINLTSRGLYNLFVQCGTNIMIAVLFCALFFLVVGLCCVFQHNHLKKKVSSD